MCGTPRSGTGLLCGLLWSTGLAGRPDEYFYYGNEPSWAAADYPGYVSWRVLSTATPNGVFGAKIMWGHLDAFLARLRDGLAREQVGDLELLARAFPDLRLVYVYRQDLVAQAVSWWKAEQTGEWQRPGRRPARGRARFDFEKIRARHLTAREHNAGWRRWFRENDVEPRAVAYEELVADPIGVARRVLASIGAARAEDEVSIRKLTERQGDSLNEGWIRRYRRMAAAGDADWGARRDAQRPAQWS